MSKTIATFLLAFFSSCIIFLNGCSNDPVTPVVETIDVNGKVTDRYGHVVSGVTAIIGSKSTTTAGDGSFVITGVPKPYDLKLLQRVGKYNVGTVYEGLTTSSPVASNAQSDIFMPANIKVNIPALSANQKAYIAFTDGRYVECHNEDFAPDNITVDWPDISGGISGKVVVLVYTNSGSSIASYDKFGEKNITLTRGDNVSVTFDPSDLALVPGDTTISGSITYPGAYSPPASQLILSFRAEGSLFNGAVIAGTETVFYNYLIPTGLPVPVRIAVQGVTQDPASGLPVSNLMEYFSGSILNPYILTTNTILAPVDHATLIDTTSAFTVSSEASGVNAFYFSSSNNLFFVYTASSAVKLPNFSNYGVEIGLLAGYSWSVDKWFGLPTTDVFVSDILFKNPNRTGLGEAAVFNFTTKP